MESISNWQLQKIQEPFKVYIHIILLCGFHRSTIIFSSGDEIAKGMNEDDVS